MSSRGPRTITVPRKAVQAYADTLYILAGDDWRTPIKGVTYAKVGEMCGLSGHISLAAKRALQRLEILNAKDFFPGGPSTGKSADYTLLVPPDEAVRRINSVADSNGRLFAYTTTITHPHKATLEKEAVKDEHPYGEKPGGFVPIPIVPPREERVVVATRETEEVRAIAGPEHESAFEALRPMRKNEGAALIEAASQYKQRAVLVATKLKELEDIGVHIDPDLVVIERDTMLENVALVLPYVVELEHRCANYERVVKSLQDQVKGATELRATVNKQKAQIDRLIAEKVARAS